MPQGGLVGRDGPGGDDPPSQMFYRVFLVPDFWYDYSEYTFTYGAEFMPVYLGVDARMVVDVKLLVDGQEFPYQEYDLQLWNFGTPISPDWEYTYGIWFHSDRLPNGAHNLQLVTTLQLDPTSVGPDTTYLTMTSPPSPTTLSNPILFMQWDNLMVGTNHTFSAATTVFPATWEIDVWDANGYGVTSATGTTSDGHISWTWDFYDDFGVLRDNVETDPYFDPWVTVTPSGNLAAQGSPAPGSPPRLKGSPTPVTPQQQYLKYPTHASCRSSAQALASTQSPRPLDGGTPTERPAPLSSIDYPYSGGWIVAYQDHAKNNPDARSALLQMFFSLSGTPSQAGLSVGAILLKFGNTNEVDMSPDPVQNMIDRNASWDNLRDHLLQPLCRNLYLSAHGNAFDVGGDWENYGPDGRGLGAGCDMNHYQTANGPIECTTDLTSGWCQRLKKPIADDPHPYRFVFMDTCSSATGPWCYPFGMIPATNSIEYFRADGERPSAFVGWSEDVEWNGRRNGRTEKGFGDYQQYADYRTSWAFNWLWNSQTTGLDAALGLAQTQSQWLPPGRAAQYLRIYGLNTLRFNEYNQRLFSFPPQ